MNCLSSFVTVMFSLAWVIRLTRFSESYYEFKLTG